MYDVVLCLGAEKLSHEDKAVGMAAIGTAVDVEVQAELAAEGLGGPGTTPAQKRSFFMDIYAGCARVHEHSGATARGLRRRSRSRTTTTARSTRARSTAAS